MPINPPRSQVVFAVSNCLTCLRLNTWSYFALETVELWLKTPHVLQCSCAPRSTKIILMGLLMGLAVPLMSAKSIPADILLHFG
mmetsp:Transcript_30301/g.63422  ORF Transcript_30301/g.63422 Transcript_30301/m.63422 type:complete len:84 (+) Transcript_30301:17-268(+)